MRRSAATLVPASLMVLVACQRPEVEAYRQHPRPVVVVCTVTPDAPGAQDFAATLEAALRVRLATRVVVVPEGVTPPADAVRLEVNLERKGIVKSTSGAAVGWGVGTSVGVLSAAAGDRDWFFDGLFWGLFAGNSAAASEDRFAWLGYYPDKIESQARLMESGDTEPLAAESIDTDDLLPALQPLRGGEGTDEIRVQEAEAEAYARVLVAKLTDRFQWQRGPARYYGAKAMAPEAEAPKAEPLNQPDPPVPAQQPVPEPQPGAPPAEN
ncbi:MAG: hypothetical protein JST05_00815 [Acidobacteria bacterium]|nr:hypothetical protein [Acidobacteriota bacterium]